MKNLKDYLITERMNIEDLKEVKDLLKVFQKNGGEDKLGDKLIDYDNEDLLPEVREIVDRYDPYVEDVLQYALNPGDDLDYCANRIKDMAEENEIENGTEPIFVINFLQDILSFLNIDYDM